MPKHWCWMIKSLWATAVFFQKLLICVSLSYARESVESALCDDTPIVVAPSYRVSEEYWHTSLLPYCVWKEIQHNLRSYNDIFLWLEKDYNISGIRALFWTLKNRYRSVISAGKQIGSGLEINICFLCLITTLNFKYFWKSTNRLKTYFKHPI